LHCCFQCAGSSTDGASNVAESGGASRKKLSRLVLLINVCLYIYIYRHSA
jgi:hypothetical protein